MFRVLQIDFWYSNKSCFCKYLLTSGILKVNSATVYRLFLNLSNLACFELKFFNNDPDNQNYFLCSIKLSILDFLSLIHVVKLSLIALLAL